MLLNKLEYGVTIFDGAPETWAITLLPLFVLWGYCLYRREINLRLVVPDLAILLVTGVLVHGDNTHRFAYHLFSGMIAYLCYRAMIRLNR